MHVASDERNRLIVASTVDMAHALDLNVVAEGVETPEIAEAVSKLGANTIQGYLISPPMPAGKVEDWVNNWNNEHEVPEGTPVTW
jgi:EAL domain-containing protein (putative c-di-GMP-specific phosphodiesterase class I)